MVAIVAAMQWANAAWAWIDNRHLRALGAVVVTLGGGFVLMKVLEVIVKALDPGAVTGAATYSATAQTAQVGVCISLCSLLVGLVIALWARRPALRPLRCARSRCWRVPS